MAALADGRKPKGKHHMWAGTTAVGAETLVVLLADPHPDRLTYASHRLQIVYCAIALLVYCGVGTLHLQAEEPGMDGKAQELLRQYQHSLSWLQSVVMDVRTTADTPDSNKKLIVDVSYRQDGTNIEWVGNDQPVDLKGKPISDSTVLQRIESDRSYYVSDHGSEFPVTLIVQELSTYRSDKHFWGDDPSLAGPMDGRIFGNDHKSVRELLAMSPAMRVRPDPENVLGVPCQVLEGVTPYGKVMAWIAPSKGYNALKWVIEKAPADRFDARSIASQWPEAKLSQWTATFQASGIGKVAGVSVVTEGTFDLRIQSDTEKESHGHYVYRRSGIVMHPDFTAIGAFRPKVPDGTRVQYNDVLDFRFEWRDGRMLPDATSSADHWDWYVRDFIEKYRLDGPQSKQAMDILAESKKRATEYRLSHRPDYQGVANLLADNPKSAPAREKMKELGRPIEDLFLEMGQRLEKIPTESQRKAHQARATTRPS
jgi:hypothetical protein